MRWKKKLKAMGMWEKTKGKGLINLDLESLDKMLVGISSLCKEGKFYLKLRVILRLIYQNQFLMLKKTKDTIVMRSIKKKKNL